MTGKFKIEWIDGGRWPKCSPDPAYPTGKDIELVSQQDRACKASLPYPAKRCGIYTVICSICGASAGVTTAGRPDDPRSVQLPCAVTFQ